MSIEQAEELLGRPQSVLGEENDEYSRMLLYDSFALSFSTSDDLRLTSIEVDSETECRSLGEQVFSLGHAGVLNLLRVNGVDLEAVSEKRDEVIGEIALRVEALRMTFYFDLEDNLMQVQWGPFFDLERDEIIWPSSE